MAIVQELLPGDVVKQGDRFATFIASEPHPNYIPLRLVIWKLDDGTWSLDALLARQDVGQLVPATRLQRWSRIQEVFRA